jgi:hypothetical protein
VGKSDFATELVEPESRVNSRSAARDLKLLIKYHIPREMGVKTEYASNPMRKTSVETSSFDCIKVEIIGIAVHYATQVQFTPELKKSSGFQGLFHKP